MAIKSDLKADYSSSIRDFLTEPTESILGKLTQVSDFDVTIPQRNAWEIEIKILKGELVGYEGQILFEFVIPRMGHRVDAVLIIESIVFVIEFKAGADRFEPHAVDQVWDYGLDLKNFHEESHNATILPVLISTEAPPTQPERFLVAEDRLLSPVCCSKCCFRTLVKKAISELHRVDIDPYTWEHGRYQPTPTIIEAAKALYSGHNVEEISRRGASAKNLSITSGVVEKIISRCRDEKKKAICFVTGVPGAGKTLVGLNVATKHFDPEDDLYSVFLSGNGPLVKVLCESLAIDHYESKKNAGRKSTKSQSRTRVKAFIQNVHHFRDDCLRDDDRPPTEHVALFDEAQRAWNRDQTVKFMRRKKGIEDFNQSEPEFLISCLNRHTDWAVIVCLVGGGQEINSGEAGISEWVEAINHKFPKWEIHLPPALKDSEYHTNGKDPAALCGARAQLDDGLHLAVSLRSFRASKLSHFVKSLLDVEEKSAKLAFQQISENYPLVITREINSAKNWLKEKARGTERYGFVVSSQAARLKAHGIDVRPEINPIHWFLKDKTDVRSSYYLEDVATEFHIQGLELDWAGVIWDGDFRFQDGTWKNWSFRGSRWEKIHKTDRQIYQKNAYRVLMTRARQGMVIVVPKGSSEDPTRSPEFYEETFEYLTGIGIPQI